MSNRRFSLAAKVMLIENVTGHYRHGILLAPVTGEAVVAGILGEPLPAEVEPFAATRFAVEQVPS